MNVFVKRWPGRNYYGRNRFIPVEQFCDTRFCNKSGKIFNCIFSPAITHLLRCHPVLDGHLPQLIDSQVELTKIIGIVTNRKIVFYYGEIFHGECAESLLAPHKSGHLRFVAYRQGHPFAFKKTAEIFFPEQCAENIDVGLHNNHG